MKFKFLKKAAAFVTAAVMAVGTLAVLPEECLPKFGIVVSAEESNLYTTKTEQVCNNAQFTINSIYIKSNGIGKMDVTITKSENVAWTGSEGTYVKVYGKKRNTYDFIRISTIGASAFGSCSLSFYVDGSEDQSPIETYSEIYFDFGYSYGNNENNFVSCTKIYTSTSMSSDYSNNLSLPVMDEANAKSFLAFIFNKSEFLKKDLSGDIYYQLLTGQFSGTDYQKRQCAYSLLEAICACIDKYTDDSSSMKKKRSLIL